MLFFQKPRRPTQHPFLNSALEINNLSFYHTKYIFTTMNNKFVHFHTVMHFCQMEAVMTGKARC